MARKGSDSRRQRLTPEQRAQFSRERRELVGKIITQKDFEGALVIEHVRGSQYLLRLANGDEVFASHKKQRQSQDNAFTEKGWRLWECRR